jgi:hypothetical protein
MTNVVTAAIAGLPLKEMEVSLLRSAILDQVAALDLNGADFREAIDLASYLHRDQTRQQRGSMPLVFYIEHPLRNTLRALRYGITDPDTLIGVILHDTFEDAAQEFSAVIAGIPAATEQQARENALSFLGQRFSPAVADIVNGLSNPLLPDGLTRARKNEAYIEHVGASPQIFVAKFVDFADNALSLHHSMNAGFVKRQATKYGPLVVLFAARLDDADVLAFVGPEAVEDMKAQLAANRLEEFADQLRRVFVIPPSTSRTVPLTNAASSDTRKRTAYAMSTGRTGRPDTVMAVMVARTSAKSALPGVDVTPGATVLTRTPRGPYSADQLRVSCSTAAFEAV